MFNLLAVLFLLVYFYKPIRIYTLRAYRYYKTQDGISLDDKANFSNMYRWYHALGQNGMMTHIYNEVLDMPVRGGDDHDAG